MKYMYIHKCFINYNIYYILFLYNPFKMFFKGEEDTEIYLFNFRFLKNIF